MIRIYDYDEISGGEIFLRGLTTPDVSGVVSGIINDVRVRGDEALIDYTRKFDNVQIDSIEVPREEIDRSLSLIPPEFRRVLETAAKNIRAFHSRQVREGFRMELPNGCVMGQKITPIEKVGLYIPGGTASYPSSVMMNAIPAKLAGCAEIVMASPPAPDGHIPPSILAAAKLAGIDRVFRIGGAQAIAAFAYGTRSVPRVYKVVGPGNAYVAEAKRQVYGRVGIEMIAGPSEILVIADAASRADCVAADMLSQAEHDRMSTAVLVTDSRELACRVQSEIERQLDILPRCEIARASIEENGKIIVTKDLWLAVEASNRLAPEHLELFLDDPTPYLEKITNAGSVFLGRDCPEALGDYLAGPNHTLPTVGSARFSSPLSVDDFIKKTQFTYFTPDALRSVREDVALFARAEGLEAHARSALSREDGVK